MKYWLLFLLLTSPLLAQSGDYATLLERAKKSDPTLDFQALRRAYANLPDYSGYIVPESNGMLEAANKSDWDLAKEEAESLLKQNYLDLYAHHILLLVAEQNKDGAAAAHHEYMLDGLMTAICGGRDGKSEKTAWPILSVNEQYQVCRLLGFRIKNRSLVPMKQGAYEVTNVVTQDGQERTVFFDVSGFFGKFCRPAVVRGSSPRHIFLKSKKTMLQSYVYPVYGFSSEGRVVRHSRIGAAWVITTQRMRLVDETRTLCRQCSFALLFDGMWREFGRELRFDLGSSAYRELLCARSGRGRSSSTPPSMMSSTL